MMKTAREYLYETGTIAIIRQLDDRHLPQLVQALYDGGIRLVEVTMNSQAAAQQIRRLQEDWSGKLCVGAGTVTDLRLAEEALAAGAAFIVTPNLEPAVVSLCLNRDILITPGVMTPTEIAAAMAMGCETVKLFPAAPLGPAYLKAVLSPLNEARIIAVGGISADNASEFYTAGAAGVGVGGSLCRVPADGGWSKVSDQASRLLAAYRSRS